MLCLMHEATPRGVLLINGKGINERQLSALVGSTPKEVESLLAELEDAGVYSREEDGTIYSRRMRRDDAKAARDKANGKGGGNPNLIGGVNPPANPRNNPTDNGGDKAHGTRATPTTQRPEARGQKENNSDRPSHSSPPERQGAAGQDFSKDELDRIEGLILPEVTGLPVALNQDISPIVGCYQRGATDTDVVNGIRAAVGSGMRATRWKAFAGWIDRALADRTTPPTSNHAQTNDASDIIARFAAKNGLTPDGQPISN
jgi:hypothetical protein